MKNPIVIPWRLKNFVSNKFPLLFHYIANYGVKGNSPEHWDEQLKNTWNDKNRIWPTKNELIKKITKADEKIVDIGCGNGGILRFLRNEGYISLYGLEISRYAIERLTEEGINMSYGNLPDIPYENEQFDFVISSQVLEHIINRKKFISEIHRILKNKGRAAIFVPDDCLGPIDEHEHVIKYNRKSLQKFLQKYFQIKTIESIVDENHTMPVLFALVQK
jgi:SAM-dependent methyltransferase